MIKSSIADKNFAVLRFVLIILGFLFVMVGTAFSHPHVFIAQNLTIEFDEKGLKGIDVCWKFDDMFSTMICDDYDQNKNGILENAEVASIKEKAFSYIAKYNYFIYVKIDGKPFQVKYVTDFSARIEKGKLIYEFFIPCHVSAGKNFKHIIIDSYDPTYSSAIYFTKKHPYKINNNGPFEVTAQIKRDQSTSIYYDMVHPWGLFFEFRLKQ